MKNPWALGFTARSVFATVCPFKHMARNDFIKALADWPTDMGRQSLFALDCPKAIAVFSIPLADSSAGGPLFSP